MIRVIACVGLLTACGSSRRAPEPVVVVPADAAVDATAIDAPAVATVDDSDVHDHDGPDGHDEHDGPEASCDELVANAAMFEPVLAPDAPERDWNLVVRAHVLEEDCEHTWTGEVRACLQTGGRCELPPDLAERLGKLGELGAAISDARKKPATIGCKQVVASHYGTVRWQGKLVGFPAKARAQMIADSRALMAKACTAEAWTDRTRACLVLGGADLCFFGTRIRRMWNYPADGSVRTLGIRECDDYDAAVTKLANCTKLEAYTRDSLKRMAEALKANIAAASPAERAKRAGSCQAALAPIEAIVRENGC